MLPGKYYFILGLMPLFAFIVYAVSLSKTSKIYIFKSCLFTIFSVFSYMVLFLTHAWLSGVITIYHNYRYVYDLMFCLVFVLVLTFIQHKYFKVKYVLFVILNLIIFIAYTLIKYYLIFNYVTRS
jgi:hypothetical protein